MNTTITIIWIVISIITYYPTAKTSYYLLNLKVTNINNFDFLGFLLFFIVKLAMIFNFLFFQLKQP